VHIEACKDLDATIAKIKECGCKVGVSVKPATPVSALKPYLDKIDMILIMSVEPGFGGQKFIPTSLAKIEEARAMVNESGLNIDIQVDGGIYTHNVEDVLKAGANIIVAGSAVYNGDTVANTKAMMEILKKYE
jgi:ribulose-phosphate 3-epimerase